MSFLLTALKVMTTLAAIAMCLSPLPDTRHIYKPKCTDDISALPLVSLWATVSSGTGVEHTRTSYSLPTLYYT